MYKVLVDGTLLCDSRIEELALINPVVKLEENKAGSFSFKMPPTHPFYDAIQRRKSVVQVYQGEEMIFSGICIKDKDDFYKQKNIECEGELTYLNDSIQRPKHYTGMTVRGLLEAFIEAHNSQVDDYKRLTVGMVTVTDSNDYISCYTNMETTMKAIKEDLVDDLGGFIRIRYADGVKYIDYLAESPNTNSQVIKLGKNLMDFVRNRDTTEIATAIIPLGAKLEESAVEGLETRLDIKSVNNGLDYVHSEEAVNTYGWIYKPVTWDNVTTPEALKAKGEKYLSDTQFEKMVIEAKAVDLHLTNKDIEQFKILDQIHVISAPHGLDRYFRLTKMTLNLNNPEKDTVTLGKEERVTLSVKTNQANEAIKKAIESITPASTILKQAIANATQLIQSATNGYVTTVMNEDGTPKELLIMDTDSIKTATKVWRWNINGLGYSSTGYKGEYALAMTMDGGIVADFIKVGTMLADRIQGGILKLGGHDNSNGTIQMLDAEGNIIGTWDNFGLDIHSADGADKCALNNGYFYFYKDGELSAGIGASYLVGSNEDGSERKYRNASFRMYGDVMSFSLDGYKPTYIINPYNYPVTSENYTETNIFRGSTRFLGSVNVNDAITTEGLMHGLDVKATKDVVGENLIVNNMGINGGAVQPVEWVWNPEMQRYCLCTIT